MYNIDSHKIIFHPLRVAEWVKGHGHWNKSKSVYPIYAEISPVGVCNHRCIFCALDYIGYKNRSLDKNILKKRLTEMSQLGLKSVMFAGEGEPALWKPLPEVLDHCAKVGIDTALTTNMALFNGKNADNFLRNCSWIKTSINAGTKDTYALIHRTKPSDFDRVMDNFKICVELRRKRKYSCTLGAQMLLLPENVQEALLLAEKLKKIGIDYLVIKPYSQHLYSLTRKYEKLDYRNYFHLEKELESLDDHNFNVIFRINTMNKLLEKKKSYQRCCSTPFFWTYIMSDGSVYGCSAFLGDKRFCYGNINELSFKQIWEGPKRKKNYHFVRDKLSVDECRKNCRMDEINRYLWKLKNPDEHVNFI
ncbi:MAG: radical SAM protein [Elusimicrobiota bacterium]